MASSQKILVPGGAGYIGSHTVAELINQGYVPVIVDDFSKSDRTLLEGLEKITGRKMIFYEGNCGDKKFIKKVVAAEGKIEAVMNFAAYHLVGESVKSPLMYYDNNIGSIVGLLDAMQEEKINKMIFSSSCTVYGEPDHIPVAEDAPFKKPESPYGATKQMCEQILEDAVKANPDLKVISLRYFNPVGAHPSSLIGELPIEVPGNLVPYITQTAAGIRKKLTIFGSDYNTPDGTCLRDYIHITDVATAHVAALRKMMGESKQYQAYNLGTGVGVSVMELVKTFIKINNVDLPYELGPRRPGDVEKTYADPTLAHRELNWKTVHTMEEALRDAWNWQKKISKIA